MAPKRIVDIVMQSLKPVVQHHHITVYVNKDELKTEKEGFGDNIIIELEQVMLDFGLNFGLKL